jgi:hypothetical protein
MKPFNSKKLVEDGFNIPNLHPDFRFTEGTRSNWDGRPYTTMTLEVATARVQTDAVANGLTIRDREWLSIAVFSKQTGKIVDHSMHCAKWAGLVARDSWDSTGAFLDALYYMCNPPTLRLLNGKLRKGIYKEVARRIRSRHLYTSTFTKQLLDTVIAETKRLNPMFTNQDVLSYLKTNYGIDNLRVCFLSNEIILRNLEIYGNFGGNTEQYYYSLNPHDFGYREARYEHGHAHTWLHETQVMFRGRAYTRDSLVMQHCPECGNESPAEGFNDGACWHCNDNRYKIHSYSTKVPTLLRFKAKNVKPSTLYLGIELEYEATDKDAARIKVGKQLAGHAIMKSDGSIRNGFEIVTCPATLDIHMEEFKKFYDNLPAELFAASNTGMHVHVSRKPLNLFTIGKMTEFTNRLDNKGFIAYVAGRIDNMYARQDEQRTVSYPLVNKNGGTNRTNALNLNPTDTIEFRIFSTPINWEQFASRLEFCQALTDYCQPAQTGTSLKHLTHHASFINWLQSRRKDYPELSNHLKGFA